MRGFHQVRHVSLGFEILEARIALSDCTVILLTDTLPNGLPGELRYCLRQALAGDMIDMTGVTGQIDLRNRLPDLAVQGLTLQGPGADQLTVRRGSAAIFRVFTVSPGGSVSIQGIAIENGTEEYGGGILNRGQLSIADCLIQNNTAFRQGLSGGFGGGIHNEGRLEIHSSLIQANRARVSGGGIHSIRGATTTLFASAVIDNNAEANSGDSGIGGGGIHNSGSLTISESILADNETFGIGGAIVNLGSLSLEQSWVTGNRVTGPPAGSGGGGIFNGGGGLGQVNFSRIESNQAVSAGGGGIANNSTMTISFSTIAYNTAWASAGGISSGGTGQTMLELRSSTVARNQAGQGGGVVNSVGEMHIVNSTITRNAAVGKGMYSAGGGVAVFAFFPGDTRTIVRSSTIAENVADGQGGGVAISQLATFDVANTIIGCNWALQSPDVSGRVGSRGHNVICDASNGSGFDITDLLDTDPLLGPLDNYGGFTETHALLPGSPAIDTGDNDLGTGKWDQRGEGFPRLVGILDPDDPLIDIGAFEVQTGLAPGQLASGHGTPRPWPATMLDAETLGWLNSSLLFPRVSVPSNTANPIHLTSDAPVVDRSFAPSRKALVNLSRLLGSPCQQSQADATPVNGLAPVNMPLSITEPDEAVILDSRSAWMAWPGLKGKA